MGKRLGVVMLIVVSVVVLFTGCASFVVPKPTSITFENAMTQLGKGILAMKIAEGNMNTGLVADEVEVTFNVTASGDQGGTLNLEATPISIVKGTLDISSKYAAQRSNQITIKFKNLLYADRTKINGHDPATIRGILEIILDPHYNGHGPIFFLDEIQNTQQNPRLKK